MADQCANLNETQCEANNDCVIWRLDTLQVFTKCMSITECNSIQNTSIFLGACTCDNSGWNDKDKRCECGRNSNPQTIFSMYDSEICLPLGTCPNNTQQLVFNSPDSDTCQCVENAEIDMAYEYDDNSRQFCKCKSGFVRSQDNTSCVIPPPQPDPVPMPDPAPNPQPEPTPQPNPGQNPDYSKPTPSPDYSNNQLSAGFAILITFLVILVLASVIVIIKSLKKKRISQQASLEPIERSAIY